MRLTLDAIARATSGRVEGAGAVVASNVSTDSRSVASGQLFVALRGERFDGHAFLDGVQRAGAAAALVDHVPKGLALPCVVVDDTTQALGRLAAAWRAQFGGPVIAITGSNGKTTTKEMCAALLREAGVPARKSPGNLNNHIGLPLSILGLEPSHRALVVELGMNHLGEIDALARIASPDVGAITQVAAAHLGPVGSLASIARAKGELLEHIRPRGQAVLNADDPNVMGQRARSTARCVRFGIESDAEYRAVGDPGDLDRGRFRLEAPRFAIDVALPLPGRHLILDALCATACIDGAGLLGETPGATVKRALEGFEGLPGRLQLHASPDGLRLLDDSYNANPASVHAALRTLEALRGDAQSFLVLGDMLELGPQEERLHTLLGREIAETVAGLIALGPLAARAARAARESGLARAESLGDPLEAAERIRAWAKPGDIVLIKGSRGSRMERVAQELLRT